MTQTGGPATEPIGYLEANRQPGVYRAIGDPPTPPLYIGSTRYLPRRIAQHKRLADWYPQVVRWTFEPYPTLDEAEAAEVALILAEQPLHNRALRGAPQKAASRRHYFPAGAVVDMVGPSVDLEAVSLANAAAPSPVRRNSAAVRTRTATGSPHAPQVNQATARLAVSLTAAMKAKALSVSGLADAVGQATGERPPEYIMYRWLSGRGSPQLIRVHPALITLARVLDLDPSALIMDAVNPEDAPSMAAPETAPRER